MSLLYTFLRVLGFVLFFTALLRVKKTRLRHLPSRRTRVSRHHGETCIWLERLTSAVLDMFKVALQEEAIAEFEQNITGIHSSFQNNNNSSRIREKSIGNRIASRRLLGIFEEHVEAMLEDRGIAAHAICKVHSIGDKLPIIRAIRVTNLTGTESMGVSPAGVSSNITTNINNNKSNNSSVAAVVAGAASSVAAAAVGVVRGSERVNIGNNSGGVGIGTVGNNNNNSSITGNHKLKSRVGQSVTYPSSITPKSSNIPISTTTTSSTTTNNVNINNSNITGENIGDIWRRDSFYDETLGVGGSNNTCNNNNNNNNNNNTNNSPLPPSALEVEAEVEYTGGIDVSLQADICLPRGRQLPVSIRFSDIEYIKSHIRVRATLQQERATMDSQRRPYLQCTLWLESEPTFSLKVTTFFSQYRICNFFAVPVIIKFLLLRFVRHRMMHPTGAGLNVKIPLPEDIIDGGIQSWCGSFNEAATNVNSLNGCGLGSR